MLKTLFWKLNTYKLTDEIAENFPISTGTISHGIKIPISIAKAREKSEECILYVHGMNDNVLSLNSFMNMLSKLLKIDAATFDPIGFSITKKYNIEPSNDIISDNIKHTLEYLTNKGYKKINILAESSGCLFYMSYAIKYSDYTKKVILINPPVEPISAFNLHKLGITLDSFKLNNISDNLADYEEPILMICSENDMFITPDRAEHLWDIHKNTLKKYNKEPYKLVIVPNATHLSLYRVMGLGKFRDLALEFYRS